MDTGQLFHQWLEWLLISAFHLPFFLFSFILWQTWRLLFLSHYYISIYFTKPKLKLKPTENAALGAQCCQRVAYLYALFVLVPAN